MKGTEPTIFVTEVAKQHDVFAGAIAFGELVSARACFFRRLPKIAEEDPKMFRLNISLAQLVS